MWFDTSKTIDKWKDQRCPRKLGKRKRYPFVISLRLQFISVHPLATIATNSPENTNHTNPEKQDLHAHNVEK